MPGLRFIVIGDEIVKSPKLQILARHTKLWPKIQKTSGHKPISSPVPNLSHVC